jgi:hypothetical protein
METNKFVVIGITGRKYNGKDTLAEYLVKNHNFIQLSFAEPLKQICQTLFGFSNEQLYGNLKEVIDPRWGISPRTAFQYIGTELFRKQMKIIMPHIQDNFWIECLSNKIKSITQSNPEAKIVISDVRFPNEVDVIRSFGGNVFRVTRPSENNVQDCHESELLIESLNVDSDIMNDSDLKTLFNNFDKIITQFI